MDMIPTGELRVEFHTMIPPKPISVHFMVNGKSVAIVSIEELKKTIREIEAMAANLTSEINKWLR